MHTKQTVQRLLINYNLNSKTLTFEGSLLPKKKINVKHRADYCNIFFFYYDVYWFTSMLVGRKNGSLSLNYKRDSMVFFL